MKIGKPPVAKKRLLPPATAAQVALGDRRHVSGGASQSVRRLASNASWNMRIFANICRIFMLRAQWDSSSRNGFLWRSKLNDSFSFLAFLTMVFLIHIRSNYLICKQTAFLLVH